MAHPPTTPPPAQVSGRPIKFVGTGEKMEALEPFYPERMASRILGAYMYYICCCACMPVFNAVYL